MTLNPDKIRSYFETRLGRNLARKSADTTRCCFHDDRQPSLSLNFEKGAWKCHAGCGQGGLLDFEMRFSSCDRTTASANIAELTGEPQLLIRSQQPEAIYQYHDAQGRLVFEKLRYPGKRFVQRKPNGKGYDYKLDGCAKPLYRLPELLIANEIIVCEGEKDSDNVRALNLNGGDIHVAATTNFDGAGRWRDEYAPFFAGKRVVILPDNDELGRKHGEQIAHSVYRYASGVKIVSLPGLDHKGDVSDYLKAHSAAELVSEIQKAPQWHPPESTLLVNGIQFMNAVPDEVDWLVEPLIQRDANGFICAVPKGGKSWAAADLALSLATGSPWLQFRVPRAVSVALISREDNPALTAWRLRHLLLGKACDADLIAQNLYVNSRAQSPELMLDNPEQVAELVRVLKQRRIQFAIFDVFNVMHSADENDNTEMRGVLRKLSAIQTEVGCALAVIHHFNKTAEGSMTQRLRGSSAIAGWAEWLTGISLADEEAKVRRMDFELKAAQPPDPIHFRIESNDSTAWLEKTDYSPRKQPREGATAAQLM